MKNIEILHESDEHTADKRIVIAGAMQVAFCLMWLNSESESNRGSSPESKASKLLKCIAGIAQRFVSASFDMFRLFHDGFALDRI